MDYIRKPYATYDNKNKQIFDFVAITKELTIMDDILKFRAQWEQQFRAAIGREPTEADFQASLAAYYAQQAEQAKQQMAQVQQAHVAPVQQTPVAAPPSPPAPPAPPMQEPPAAPVEQVPAPPAPPAPLTEDVPVEKTSNFVPSSPRPQPEPAPDQEPNSPVTQESRTALSTPDLNEEPNSETKPTSESISEIAIPAEQPEPQQMQQPAIISTPEPPNTLGITASEIAAESATSPAESSTNIDMPQMNPANTIVATTPSAPQPREMSSFAAESEKKQGFEVPKINIEAIKSKVSSISGSEPNLKAVLLLAVSILGLLMGLTHLVNGYNTLAGDNPYAGSAWFAAFVRFVFGTVLTFGTCYMGLGALSNTKPKIEVQAGLLAILGCLMPPALYYVLRMLFGLFEFGLSSPKYIIMAAFGEKGFFTQTFSVSLVILGLILIGQNIEDTKQLLGQMSAGKRTTTANGSSSFASVPTIDGVSSHELKDNRSLLSYLLLGFVTLRIWDLFAFSEVAKSYNTATARAEDKMKVHFALVFFILGPFTLGIGALVWFHILTNRVNNEATRRGAPGLVSTLDFWLWGVIGSVFCFLGWWVYVYKLFAAMNYISDSYNKRGV